MEPYETGGWRIPLPPTTPIYGRFRGSDRFRGAICGKKVLIFGLHVYLSIVFNDGFELAEVAFEIRYVVG